MFALSPGRGIPTPDKSGPTPDLDIAMEPQNDLVETESPGWKWTALFTPPTTADSRWQAWLAAAQRAEESSLLTYWAKRYKLSA
jgi:hypothetical protein